MFSRFERLLSATRKRKFAERTFFSLRDGCDMFHELLMDLQLQQTFLLGLSAYLVNCLLAVPMLVLFGFVLARAFCTGKIWGWAEETCPVTGQISLNRFATIEFKSSPKYFLFLATIFGLGFYFCLASLVPGIRPDAGFAKALPELTPAQGLNVAVGSILLLLSCIMGNAIFTGEMWGYGERPWGSLKHVTITFASAPIQFVFWMTLLGCGIVLCLAHFLGVLPIPVS